MTEKDMTLVRQPKDVPDGTHYAVLKFSREDTRGPQVNDYYVTKDERVLRECIAGWEASGASYVAFIVEAKAVVKKWVEVTW